MSTFYTVCVLDGPEHIAIARDDDDLLGVARLLVGLGYSTDDEWAKPLLDEHGEFSVLITDDHGNPIGAVEWEVVGDHLDRYGVVTPATPEEIGIARWGNPNRRAD